MNSEYIDGLFDLTGKKAIVTGGSQGIGRGIAISLAAFGAEVTVIGRNTKLLDETCEIIREMKGVCYGKALDLTNWSDVEQFFLEYEKENDTLDIFINNAGYTVRAEIGDTQKADIEGLLDTNVKAAIQCVQLAANQMKKQKSGNIVIITSVNAFNSHPNQGMYSVTKFALEGAMKAFASTLAEYGIRVNSCAPGAIDTAINAEVMEDAEIVKAVEQKIPMGIIGASKDVGDVVACMVSDACRYMTGASVVVDGGMMLKRK